MDTVPVYHRIDPDPNGAEAVHFDPNSSDRQGELISFEGVVVLLHLPY